ncbi:hypothetical protein MMC16_001669 [Acarospora aff. strigata]|nr:hypothetical protein [Acarospora aff. strigata]
MPTLAGSTPKSAAPPSHSITHNSNNYSPSRSLYSFSVIVLTLTSTSVLNQTQHIPKSLLPPLFFILHSTLQVFFLLTHPLRALWTRTIPLRDELFLQMLLWLLNPYAVALVVFWPGWWILGVVWWVWGMWVGGV